MRKKLIAFTVFTSLALALGSSRLPNSAAMNGGTNLTSRQERAGIFQIETFDGSEHKGNCTATVLFSTMGYVDGSNEPRSWLVTAGHCFSYHNAMNNLFYVYGHYANPMVRVVYDRDTDTSGTQEDRTWESQSTVYVHPEWRANGGHTAWFGPRDLAFIRLDRALQVYDDNGNWIQEYRRPIYAGPASQVTAPYTSASMEKFSKNGFCGQGDGSLRCDTLSNLWWSPNFRHQFFQLPYGAWDSGMFEAGDSGGPLLKYAPGLTRQWEGAGGVLDVAMHGVVLGVLQGPTVFCDYIQNGNCNPSDGLATRFEGIDPWLAGIPDSADIPRIYSWNFANQFRAGVGPAASGGTNLTSVTQNSYTFPTYAGRIVGVGINKSTNQVHTWYDNSVLTIGTRSDLDAVSQHPQFPDLPMRFYNSATGRSPSQIVAMMINPNGNVHTWYDDGTASIGSISDLDSLQAPQSYQLPSGKTPDDIVAVASRPGGGVFAYYTDGTFSEGWFNDLDLYQPPRPFQTGNGRDPTSILGIDTYNNGQTLTLFAHRTY